MNAEQSELVELMAGQGASAIDCLMAAGLDTPSNRQAIVTEGTPLYEVYFSNAIAANARVSDKVRENSELGIPQSQSLYFKIQKLKKAEELKLKQDAEEEKYY